MKSVKMLVWTMALSTVSSGIVGMAKPKVYVKNQNTYSKLRSAGVLCKINADQNNERLVFVPMGEEILLGQLGVIKTLDLQPSTSGTGTSGWVFSPEIFSVTEKLWTKLNEQDEHLNEDMVVVVDNASMRGAWTIKIEWRKRSAEKSMPIETSPLVIKLKEAYQEWKKTHGDDSSSEESW